MSAVPGKWGHPHDDLAVYALDAGTPEERERVERHVEACDACRADAYSALRPYEVEAL